MYILPLHINKFFYFSQNVGVKQLLMIRIQSKIMIKFAIVRKSERMFEKKNMFKKSG
jgi:hypothetical protein